MPGITAGHHKIRGYQRLFPGIRHRLAQYTPLRTGGIRIRRGISSLKHRYFYIGVVNHLLKVNTGGFHRIRPHKAQVHAYGSLWRNHVKCLSALHLRHGAGGTQHSIELAAGLLADLVKETLKAPEIGKQNLVCKGGAASQGVQHLPHRLCHLPGEWVIFHIHHSLSQLTHDRVNRRHRSMTAAAFCMKFNICQALFRNSDEGTFPVHTWKYIFYHGSALIYNHSRMNAPFLKPVHHGRAG